MLHLLATEVQEQLFSFRFEIYCHHVLKEWKQLVLVATNLLQFLEFMRQSKNRTYFFFVFTAAGGVNRYSLTLIKPR